MCATCGCGSDEVRVDGVVPDDHHHEHHDHDHGHGHGHGHGHDELRTHTVELEQRVLARNDELAADNRRWLADRGVVAVNLMSSPGSGKTTLLERTIRELGRPVSVVEGDQETAYDADRIRAAGARAVQVNTGSGCHLDATMVHQALVALDPEPASMVVVENVGNLVCPALFDVGEVAKVVVISVTEGDDKPLKYPHMFAVADLVLVNKTDLLPYVDFDVDRLTADARRLKPGVDVMPVSAKTGAGVENWYGWLNRISSEAPATAKVRLRVD
jgi:hydrogenase nickel incorporation protein HypB